MLMLIPGGHAQSNMFDACREEGLQLIDALLRTSRGGEAFDEFHAEVGRVVFIEKRLALIERRLTALVNVDVVVKRAADLRRVAAFFLGHRQDALPL